MRRPAAGVAPDAPGDGAPDGPGEVPGDVADNVAGGAATLSASPQARRCYQLFRADANRRDLLIQAEAGLISSAQDRPGRNPDGFRRMAFGDRGQTPRLGALLDWAGLGWTGLD